MQLYILQNRFTFNRFSISSKKRKIRMSS